MQAAQHNSLLACILTLHVQAEIAMATNALCRQQASKGAQQLQLNLACSILLQGSKLKVGEVDWLNVNRLS